MTKFKTTDSLGNEYTIIVSDKQRVVACNQHRIVLSLCSFAEGSRAEAQTAIRNGARRGLAALNAASFYHWTQV